MNIIHESGDDRVAKVYVADVDGKRLEFCESVPSAGGLAEKWVMIVSTLFGCPVRCSFCDAGGHFQGPVPAQEIINQVLHMVKRRGGVPETKALKIQFARMGEPSLSPHVLEALCMLPAALPGAPVVASLSSVAPRGRDAFFEELIRIKSRHFSGRFQLQFSIHSTDADARDELIPIRKWSLPELSEYGVRFHAPGDKKVTLNFAGARNIPVDARVVASIFPSCHFLVKLTPVNPTHKAQSSGLRINDLEHLRALKQSFESAGMETILSVGNLAENGIGSNCGMYLGGQGEPAHSDGA